MKRVFALLLCVVACLMLTALPVSADPDSGTITTAHVYGAPGDIVNIPLQFTGNPGFYILYIKTRYDFNVFSIEGVDNGSYTGIVEELSDQPGRNMCNIGIEATSNMDIGGDGLLCTLRVKIKENAQPGRYGLTFYMDPGGGCSFQEHYVMPDLFSGSITVLCKDHTGVSGTCPVCGATVGNDTIEPPQDKTITPAPNTEETTYLDAPVTASELTKEDRARSENADRLAKEKEEATQKQKEINRQHKINQFFSFGGAIPVVLGKIIIIGLPVAILVAVAVLLILKRRKK